MTNLFNSSKGKNLNSSKGSHKVNCTKSIVRKIQIRSAQKLQQSYKSVLGYPWSDIEAMKEWEKMSSIIQDYQNHLKVNKKSIS